MKLTHAAVGALLALASVPASAQQVDETRLAQAVLVEWMTANCNQSKIPAMTAGSAMMVLNGYSDQQRVSAVREMVRDGMKEHYKSKEDGCAELLKTMQ